MFSCPKVFAAGVQCVTSAFGGVSHIECWLIFNIRHGSHPEVKVTQADVLFA
jgi:hypothetical protein